MSKIASFRKTREFFSFRKCHRAGWLRFAAVAHLRETFDFPYFLMR